MQWTTTGDRITLPYVAPEDDLQSTPATIKALAEAVVAELELATPVGAIMPYMGDVAPDGWLICDGSEYDPADLPELYAVNSAFHADDAPGEFRVPDLRGRSPVGDTGALGLAVGDPVWRPVGLGQRFGDQRIPAHRHGLPMSGTGGWASIGQGATGGDPESTAAITGSVSSWGGVAAHTINGGGFNMSPYTGVNFIVYAGRPTTGISPLSELAPMTTRMMIEASLAQAGIGEEEIKMLKEQLEELKRTEAK